MSAIFCARHHQRQVKRKDFFSGKDLRHITGSDALGKSFQNGSLSHARLPDEDRVVFGSAAKDLDHAADLIFPSDHGIQFATFCQCGQISAERPESAEFLIFGRGIIIRQIIGRIFVRIIFLRLVFPFTGQITGIKRSKNCETDLFHICAHIAQDRSTAAVLNAQQREEQVFRSDVIVFHGIGFIACGKDHRAERIGERHIPFLQEGTADNTGLLDPATEFIHGDPGIRQDLYGNGVIHRQNTEQHVTASEVVMVPAGSLFGCQLKGTQCPGCKMFQTILQRIIVKILRHNSNSFRAKPQCKSIKAHCFILRHHHQPA